jgi:hypothetical protein
MKGNLHALNGAIQQIDKLILMSETETKVEETKVEQE